VIDRNTSWQQYVVKEKVILLAPQMWPYYRQKDVERQIAEWEEQHGHRLCERLTDPQKIFNEKQEREDGIRFEVVLPLPKPQLASLDISHGCEFVNEYRNGRWYVLLWTCGTS
jgi:hypothetical protein